MLRRAPTPSRPPQKPPPSQAPPPEQQRLGRRPSLADVLSDRAAPHEREPPNPAVHDAPWRLDGWHGQRHVSPYKLASMPAAERDKLALTSPASFDLSCQGTHVLKTKNSSFF